MVEYYYFITPDKTISLPCFRPRDMIWPIKSSSSTAWSQAFLHSLSRGPFFLFLCLVYIHPED